MKVLVVGAGSIGSRHIKNLISLGYKDIIIVEKDRALLNQYSNRFPCYQDYLLALRNEAPDIVLVCTPTALHVDQAKLALQFKCDVFVEKPISNSSRGIDILKKLSKNRTVMVGCNWRFHKAFKALEHYLKKRTFGDVLYVRIACGYYLPTARPNRDYKKIYASRKRGGGVLLDTGSHIVNYLIALFGDVKTILSLKSSKDSLAIHSDEIAHVILKHTSGITCDISMDYVSKRAINRIEVITDQGLLILDLVGNTLHFTDNDTTKLLFNEKVDPNEMFIDELTHFFQSIKDRTKPLQDIDDAKKVLRVILNGEKN